MFVTFDSQWMTIVIIHITKQGLTRKIKCVKNLLDQIPYIFSINNLKIIVYHRCLLLKIWVPANPWLFAFVYFITHQFQKTFHLKEEDNFSRPRFHKIHFYCVNCKVTLIHAMISQNCWVGSWGLIYNVFYFFLCTFLGITLPRFGLLYKTFF
jgi:hypothetical protein